MDGMFEPVELSGQTSCVETDTDCEVEYKSLRTSYGVVSAIDTDGPTRTERESLCSPSSPGSDSGPSFVDNDSPKTTHNRTICEDQCQLLESDDDQSRCINEIAASTSLFPPSGRLDNHENISSIPSSATRAGNSSECVGNGGNTVADGGNGDSDMEHVWAVSGEQYRYYLNQFLTLQPDVAGVVVGQRAKAFFDKSKLPVTILSHIWNLADVTKDGCLCLSEFVVAMHLIVLRRNGIPVPEHLPPPLLILSRNGYARHSGAFSPIESSEFSSPKNREWTKFLDSPQSGVVSPDSKLANFDFQTSSVQQNPRIAHPVAIRGTVEERERLRGDDEEEEEWERGRTVSSSASSGVPPEAFLSRHPPLTAFSRVANNNNNKCQSQGVTGADCVSPPRTTLATCTGPASLPNFPKTTQTRATLPPPPPPRPSLTSLPPTAVSGTAMSATAVTGTGCAVLHRTGSIPLDSCSNQPNQPPPRPPPRASLSQSKENLAPSLDSVDGYLPAVNDSQVSVGVSSANFADFDRFTESRVVKQTTKQSQIPPVCSDKAEAGFEPVSVVGSWKDEHTNVSNLSRLTAKQVLDLRGQLNAEELRHLISVQRERNLTLKQVGQELQQEMADAVQERASLLVRLRLLSTDQQR